MFEIKEKEEKECQIKKGMYHDKFIGFINQAFSKLFPLQEKLKEEKHLGKINFSNPSYFNLMDSCSEVLTSMKILYECPHSNLKDFRDSYSKKLIQITNVYRIQFDSTDLNTIFECKVFFLDTPKKRSLSYVTEVLNTLLDTPIRPQNLKRARQKVDAFAKNIQRERVDCEDVSFIKSVSEKNLLIEEHLGKSDPLNIFKQKRKKNPLKKENLLKELPFWKASNQEEQERNTRNTSVPAVSQTQKRSINPQISVLPVPAETLFKGSFVTEEKEAQRKRHEQNVLKRIEKKKKKTQTVPPLSCLSQTKAPQPPNRDDEKTDIPIFKSDKKCVQWVIQKINDRTWNLTHEEVAKYFAERKFKVDPSAGKGSHCKVSLPTRFFKNTPNNENLIVSKNEDSQKGEGALILPQWDKNVPRYLRLQIKLLIDNIEKEHAEAL